MTIAVMVITDGRQDCLTRTWASFVERVHKPNIDDVALTLDGTRHEIGPLSDAHYILVNDSGDPRYAAWLDEKFPQFTRMHHETRRGFCQAWRSAWEAMCATDAAYGFMLEDDFTFTRDVELRDMQWILDCHPGIVQVALKRQPWAAEEKRAGDLVAMWPHEYHDRFDEGVAWLEARLFVTTNPCLVPRWVVEQGWPDGPECERKLADRLFADPHHRMAFYGLRDDPPRVWHIGDTRVGTGY